MGAAHDSAIYDVQPLAEAGANKAANKFAGQYVLLFGFWPKYYSITNHQEMEGYGEKFTKKLRPRGGEAR